MEKLSDELMGFVEIADKLFAVAHDTLPAIKTSQWGSTNEYRKGEPAPSYGAQRHMFGIWRRHMKTLIIPTGLVGLLILACCSTSPADPPAGSKWEPIPELTDEFNGNKLDSTKWYDHNPEWKGRQPGFFSTNNVSVSDGKLHLMARVEDLKDLPEGYHTFTTAAVKSKALVIYGYFEIKCRPMKSKASSAFWFSNNTKEEWTEIDVFEICGVGEKWKNTYNMNAHVFHTPTETNHWSKDDIWKAPFDFADGYHVYALEWGKEVIKWWVDGKVVRELKNTHWHQPLSLNFDSETMPEWFGLPEKDSLPSTFSIDYVRSWQREEH